MRRKTPLLLILIFLLAWEQNNRAAEALQPVVSIATFGGDKSRIPSWSPAFGQAISEMVFETLQSTNKNFQVVEAPPSGNGNESQPGSAKPNSVSADSKKGANSSSDSAVQNESNSSANGDFVLNGSVTEFITQTNSGTIGDFISSSSLGNLGGKWVSARVRIDWRLEDAKTKMVITRGTALSTAHGSGFDMAGATVVAEKSATNAMKGGKKVVAGKKNNNDMANFLDGMNKVLNGSPANAHPDTANTTASATNKSVTGNKSVASSSSTPAKAAGNGDSGGGDDAGENTIIGYDNSAFMESALGKATDEAVKKVVQELMAAQLPETDRITQMKKTAGKVLAVGGDDAIIVSLGSNQGLKEGDKLNLYQTVDVKDDKGNVVFTDEKLAGEIILSAVQEDKSRGSYSGDAKVQQGWTVKAK